MMIFTERAREIATVFIEGIVLISIACTAIISLKQCAGVEAERQLRKACVEKSPDPTKCFEK